MHRTAAWILLVERNFWGNAATISRRMRGHVGYTQRANTPFLGLAADGAKLALIPDQIDSDLASQQVQQILIDSILELTPDVPITCEMLLAN